MLRAERLLNGFTEDGGVLAASRSAFSAAIQAVVESPQEILIAILVNACDQVFFALELFLFGSLY